MRSDFPLQFFVEIQKIAISINPSESDIAGNVLNESNLIFLGDKLENCTDKYARAATALYHIAYYHPFFEGNKRTALLTCEVLLEDLIITANEKETYEFVLSVACGKESIDSIIAWLKSNTSFSKK